MTKTLSQPSLPVAEIADLAVTIAARRPSSTSPPTASFPALSDPNNHTSRVLKPLRSTWCTRSAEHQEQREAPAGST
ncbi:unnamed protein product [Urochloa humidicola]